MNLTRRSFLRSLGAALLTPLLPKAKQVQERDRITDFLMSRDCAGSEEWTARPECEGCSLCDLYYHPESPAADDLGGFVVPEELVGVPLPTEPTRIGPYVIGMDFGGQDYTAWMRYPRAEWDWTVDPTDAYVEPLPFDDIDIARAPAELAARQNVITEWVVVMRPDYFDLCYENVPWFRCAVDGFDA